MKQLVVGVTGGIGCGMSSVSRRLADLGGVIVDVDTIGKSVVEEDQAIIEKIKQTFRRSFFESDTKLNRKKLAELVFSDEKAREKLNAIVHPTMIEKTKSAIEERLQDKDNWLVVVDAALIFELGLDDIMDYNVVVDSPLELRIQRIQQRDGLSNREIHNRIQAQMPLENKIQNADYIVANTGSLFDLDKEVQSLFRWLRVRAKTDANNG